MAIEKEFKLYEVLLRFENGNIVGAHQIKIRRLIEDGTVLNETEMPAEPLALADIGSLINPDVIGYANQIVYLQEEVSNLKRAKGQRTSK